MSEETLVKKAKEATFTVDQLVLAKQYLHLKDVLRVVLERGKAYTIKEVDSKIQSFMKGGK